MKVNNYIFHKHYTGCSVFCIDIGNSIYFFTHDGRLRGISKDHYLMEDLHKYVTEVFRV